MANNHGGPRTPRNPAPVSGPGALSQRTDGNNPQQVQARLKGQAYGESQRLNELQSAAPLAASPVQSGQSGGKPAPAPTATALFSPTSRPDEPLTAGADFGPGDGAAPSGFGAVRDQELPDLKARFLPALLDSASKPNMPPSFVAFVRQLRDT